jgi:inner membrane protein
MVEGLTKERSERHDQVLKEIAAGWGKTQDISFAGVHDVQWNSVDVNAAIASEVRYRGIYQMVVYNADVKIKGNLTANKKNIAIIQITDSRNITNVSGTVNGSKVKFTVTNDGISFPVTNNAVSDIELTFKLRGSKILQITSESIKTTIAMSGNWSSPGFIGNSLPLTREISEDKFSAKWDLTCFNKYNTPSVGVNFHISAGTYQQVERCFTYATFFLIIFFVTLMIADIVTKSNVHILQYLIAAGAPVLFYLMTLAFSEKIGFAAGYAVSAAVIVTMITVYARMFLRKTRPALVVGTIFALSYLLNYFILQLEDFALLTSTIILAAILGTLMFMTGKINHNTNAEK